MLPVPYRFHLIFVVLQDQSIRYSKNLRGSTLCGTKSMYSMSLLLFITWIPYSLLPGAGSQLHETPLEVHLVPKCTGRRYWAVPKGFGLGGWSRRLRSLEVAK